MNSCASVGEIFKEKIWQWIVESPLKASRRCMPNLPICLEKLRWILFWNWLTRKKIKFGWFFLTFKKFNNKLFLLCVTFERTHKNKPFKQNKIALKCPDHTASIPFHRCYFMMNSNWIVIFGGEGLKPRGSVNTITCETCACVSCLGHSNTAWTPAQASSFLGAFTVTVSHVFPISVSTAGAVLLPLSRGGLLFTSFTESSQSGLSWKGP